MVRHTCSVSVWLISVLVQSFVLCDCHQRQDMHLRRQQSRADHVRDAADNGDSCDERKHQRRVCANARICVDTVRRCATLTHSIICDSCFVKKVHMVYARAPPKKNHMDSNFEAEVDDVLPVQRVGNARCVFSTAWFEQLRRVHGDDGSVAPADAAMPSVDVIARLRVRAETLFTAECDAFFEWKDAHPSSDERWLATVLKSGTLTDRTAAMTMLVQSSPFHRLKTLASLLAMARRTHHKESTIACETLKELFVVTLLPDRKLRTFAQACQQCMHSRQQGESDDLSDIDDIVLMLWLYEDALKTHYAALVAVLAAATREALEHFKKLAMKRAFEMLNAKPECEDVMRAPPV
jgi:hypothetical protein